MTHSTPCSDGQSAYPAFAEPDPYMHGGLVRGRYMHGGLVDITSNRLVFVEAEGCAGEAAASSDSTQPLPVVSLLNPSQ